MRWEAEPDFLRPRPIDFEATLPNACLVLTLPGGELCEVVGNLHIKGNHWAVADGRVEHRHWHDLDAAYQSRQRLPVRLSGVGLEMGPAIICDLGWTGRRYVHPPQPDSISLAGETTGKVMVVTEASRKEEER